MCKFNKYATEKEKCTYLYVYISIAKKAPLEPRSCNFKISHQGLKLKFWHVQNITGILYMIDFIYD